MSREALNEALDLIQRGEDPRAVVSALLEADPTPPPESDEDKSKRRKKWLKRAAIGAGLVAVGAGGVALGHHLGKKKAQAHLASEREKLHASNRRYVDLAKSTLDSATHQAAADADKVKTADEKRVAVERKLDKVTRQAVKAKARHVAKEKAARAAAKAPPPPPPPPSSKKRKKR